MQQDQQDQSVDNPYAKNPEAPYSITYSQVDSIKQEEWCFAVAFNREGTIMAAGCNEKVKIWNIEEGRLKATDTVLTEHTGPIFCLTFSKKNNWFASAGQDKTICCWKETGDNWVSCQPEAEHTNRVLCLLLNKSEDELISGSADESINIWKVDCNNNDLIFDYSLEKHSQCVNAISLNESQTSLVSCAEDSTIIVWGKGQLSRWEFKYYIEKSIDDVGFRLSFLENDMIAWQQYSQGITHIFQLENGVFTEKPQLQLTLNQAGNDLERLFPSIYNSKRQILIQKHNSYVYILRKQNDGKFKIESEPIDCNYANSFGGLTDCGQNLVLWSEEAKSMILYRIQYQ